MTLIMRLSRLFRADAHGILDHLEEPEAVLKQAIRDMEEEIRKGEADLATLTRRETQHQTLVAHLNEVIIDLSEQLDTCFEADNETLAKTVIRKKLEAESRLRHTSRQATELATSIAAQRRQLSEQQAQLQAIIDSMQPFVDHPLSSRQESPRPSATTAPIVSDEDVEIEFIRAQRQRSNQEESQS